MQIPFLAWLLQGIPETIAVVTFITVLCTQKLEWRNILKVALVQAVTAYLVRLLPLTPGVHTIILISTTALYLTWLTQIRFPLAAVGSALAVSILFFIEVGFHFSLSLLGVGSFSELLYSNVWLRILVGYPQILFLFALAWLVYRNKLNLSKYFKSVSKEW